MFFSELLSLLYKKDQKTLMSSGVLNDGAFTHTAINQS